MSTPTAAKNPRVGVGVFVLNDHGEFVIGRRKGSHGAGTYALPGGHLEFGETFEECAAREIMEETGLDIHDIKFLTATNDVMPEDNAHYITVFVTARVTGEVEVQLMEPEKCEAWYWKTWEHLHDLARAQEDTTVEIQKADLLDDGRLPKLFLPILNLFEQRPGIQPARNYLEFL